MKQASVTRVYLLLYRETERESLARFLTLLTLPTPPFFYVLLLLPHTQKHRSCDFDEITSGAVTFCSRTVLAMIVALTGMLVGGLVVAGRLMVVLCPTCRCSRIQAHVEMLISMFLVFLFGAAVALITGIGGPGT